MDRKAWQTTVHRVSELDKTEQLVFSLSYTEILHRLKKNKHTITWINLRNYVEQKKPYIHKRVYILCNLRIGK